MGQHGYRSIAMLPLPEEPEKRNPYWSKKS